MEPKIIYEDDDLMVLDKPAGMVVNKSETAKEETVQDWVGKRLGLGKEELGIGGRAGIVHRLDKETSGLLLIAKTEPAFEELQRQFKAREVKKKYLALVIGKVTPENGEINAPVGRLPWDREKFGVFPGGREARTEYKVLDYYSLAPNSYTLLELAPATGRTHQIRVHLKYLGYPIVGDTLYAGRREVIKQRKWCPRTFLHAAWLKFKDPRTGEEKIFESPLPEELKKCLTLLSR